jgi:MSHA biogenesis protein MshL
MKHPATDRRDRWLLAAILVACVFQPAGADAQSVPAHDAAPSRGIPVSRLEGADSPVAPEARPMRRAPEQLPAWPVTLLEERGRAAALDGPRTVSLTFSQSMPIAEVLLLLVRGTAFSVVTDTSVAGTFIGELKDLSMRQALEAVLFAQGLDYTLDGTVIRVAPRRTQTRLFEVDYVNVHRALQRHTRTATSLDGGVNTQLTTSAASDVFADVDAGVKALLSSSGRHHVDRKAGLVHVTDFADRLDHVAAYLDAVHVRATRQVRLDARVLEVSLGERTTIDWTAVAGRVGGAMRAGAPGAATAGLRVGDLDALVRALGEQGTIRLIAAPRMIAMNNEPAVMRAGVNDVSFGEAGAGRATAIADGLTLTVTPQIAADGIVTLNVAPVWAEKTSQVKSREGGPVPVMRLNEADTVVRVHDGEAVVISGGLQERTEARTSTGFSGFFGAQERRTARVELVVLLSASLVVPGVSRSEGLQ